MTSRQHQKHAGDNSPTTDCHHDKRVKLDQPALQAHPFENVDYWLDFEPDQQDEARTETSFDSCFSQWLDASKVNENNITPSTTSHNDKPVVASNAQTMGSTDPNDFLFFGTPTPDVDDALKLMNLGDPWDVVDQQLSQQRTGLFPEFFPPTPDSEGSPLQSQTYQPPTTLTPTTQPASVSSTPYLGDEEKLSLLSLALNLGPLNTSFLPSGPFDMGMSALCRDSPQSSTASEKNTKGQQKSSPKSSTAAAEKAASKSKARHVDRAAHNDIERRYRTNLKHKIAELRDAIPTLAGGEDEEGSGAEGSSSKVSKVCLTSPTLHQIITFDIDANSSAIGYCTDKSDRVHSSARAAQ